MRLEKAYVPERVLHIHLLSTDGEQLFCGEGLVSIYNDTTLVIAKTASCTMTDGIMVNVSATVKAMLMTATSFALHEMLPSRSQFVSAGPNHLLPWSIRWNFSELRR